MALQRPWLGNFGCGTQPGQQVGPAVEAGYGFPCPALGAAVVLVHYPGGKLTMPALPHGALGIDVE